MRFGVIHAGHGVIKICFRLALGKSFTCREKFSMQPRRARKRCGPRQRQEKADFRGILPAARLSIVFARNRRIPIAPCVGEKS
jgi:hypothetical protein